MLFRETKAVYWENYMERTNTQCGQSGDISYAKAGGTYSDHWTLRVNVFNNYMTANAAEKLK
jgi:hypothetical protein